MATGDYGVWLDGELYITGRVKDLVIVDGRNHYPQDLEFSAQESCTALRPGFVAAFSVAANELPAEVFENAASGLSRDPDDASEQLVVVGERGPGKRVDPQEVADTVRAAIAARHGVMVRDVLLVPAGSIPGPPVADRPPRGEGGLHRRHPAWRLPADCVPGRARPVGWTRCLNFITTPSPLMPLRLMSPRRRVPTERRSAT